MPIDYNYGRKSPGLSAMDYLDMEHDERARVMNSPSDIKEVPKKVTVLDRIKQLILKGEK